jgi:hypothetical protein
LLLHLVDDDAPVIQLADGTLVRFAICNLSTDPWPLSEHDRGTPLCPECSRRSRAPLTTQQPEVAT